MTTLKYHQYWIQCGNCGKESRFPVYEHDGYMLMRNPQNKADVRLLGWDDKAFDEVSDLAQTYKKKILDNLVSNALYRTVIINTINAAQLVFSSISDSSNGVKYTFGSSTVCPFCQSHNIKGWGPTEDPYETIDADYPYITHYHWDSLNQSEKEKIVYDEVFRVIKQKLDEIEAKHADF